VEKNVLHGLIFLSNFTYNENNDLVKAEYPDGKINEMTYNAQGLVTEVKNNDGTKTIMERDNRGDVIAMVDEMNRRVELTRDIMGRVLQEKSPSGKEVQYQWGGSGCASCGDGSNLNKIIDAADRAWEFKYDVMGNPLEMTYPDSSKITQEYDIAGRLTKFTNKRGQEIAYTYDADGKMIKKTTPEGEVNFTYDERDRVSEITGDDFHYRYQHGHVGAYYGTVWQEEELLSGTLLQVLANDIYGTPDRIFDGFGWNKYFNYGLSNAGSVVLGGSPPGIQYNWYGTELASLKSWMQYDTARRMTIKKKQTLYKNDYFNYDTNGLLKQSRYVSQAPYFNTSGSLNFTRDNSGLITGITGDKQLNATYDPDLQINTIQHTLPQSFAESYTYDDNGNRLTSLTNSFTYDDLNRLTESTAHEYTYDADGNMTIEKNKLSGETKKYYYDTENRMVKYEHQASDIFPVDISAEYKYDIYGRRLQKNVNGAITNFYWEGDTMTYELDAQYKPIRKYITGVGMDDYEGHLEYSEVTDWSRNLFDTVNSNPPWYSYLKDQVGTIYKVYSHKTRSIADSRAYDSFGNLVNQTGTTKTPLGFQGKYYDQESGLNYFYNRYYNPTIGRFTSEDPIRFEGGLNFNSFVGSNPITFTDKFGLERDWSSEMPNGGGLSNMRGGEFTALFGASPAEIIGWTIKGTWNDLKDFNWCCYSKCMLKKNLPTFSRKMATSFMKWTVENSPNILPILKDQFFWITKKFSILFYASIAKSAWDCYIECRK
jgi:RHS repeat-associated protein